jgi:hypothetical protein
MALATKHVPDKQTVRAKIEAIMRTADQSADTSDMKELLRYLPHPWITSAAEWAFIAQLVESVEQNQSAARAQRQALIQGVRLIGEAAGAELDGVAVRAKAV